MTNPIEWLIRSFTESSTQKKNREHAERENALKKEFSERIQAKEFQGRMYLSVDGIPLVEADDMRTNIVEAIQKVRETIVIYKTT